MRRADRLIELIGRLKQKPVVRAEDLARHLEVSVRTVYRDIAALQGQGLPIEGEAGVGFMLRGAVDLPPISFDYEELEALALGLGYVEQVGDPALASAARAARGKVGMVWASPEAGFLAGRPLRASQRPERRSPASGALLRLALRDRTRVRFSYRDAMGCASAREVRPVALIAFSEGWLLGAWCEVRADFRTFRLDRMRGVELGAEFIDDGGRNLEAYLARPQRTSAEESAT